MFESVASAPPDPILGLTEAFQKDTRPDKINLTIGVYRDEQGKTPVLECVKLAEKVLLETEQTKGYLGIDGQVEFQNLARELTLADLVPANRVAMTQTPGGTGALRVATEFLGRSFPAARIWHSTPTWPNHPSIFETARAEIKAYPYISADKKSLDFAAMMDAIEREGRPGDIICLHACCHNPTGIDPTRDQWSEIAELTAQRGMLPLVDFAYHGFGDGLDEDRASLEELTKQHEEFLVCSSYSKNFGLYSERIGALFTVCPDTESTEKVASAIKQTVRSNYSSPPRHGGSIVATVLGNPELRELWHRELDGMRGRIHAVRELFVEKMKGHGIDMSFLLAQRGMFSFSGLSPMQVDWLRSEKGIFIVGSGRINVAGITHDNVDQLSAAIAESMKA